MQIQEALTSQIADTIQEILKPKGVGVVIEAAHQCMTTRGVHKSGVSMVTMRTTGPFAMIPKPAENLWPSLILNKPKELTKFVIL